MKKYAIKKEWRPQLQEFRYFSYEVRVDGSERLLTCGSETPEDCEKVLGQYILNEAGPKPEAEIVKVFEI